MFQLNSNVDINHPDAKANGEFNFKLVSELTEALRNAASGGGDKAIKKLQDKGKLSVRTRIDYLLDADTPFLELSPLAALNQYNNNFPGAGIVTGIGQVHGKPVMVIANDPTVKGGTYVKETIRKHLRAQEIAWQNQLPCIYLVDSGGIFLPEQAEVFPDKDDFGRIFFNQARMSAQGIPQIAVVLGSCTAGGAYIPAMSDETIIVKNQGTIFLAGPPLVKAATGEVVTDEELGGGSVHASISGVADHLADNEVHALHLCRNAIETLQVEQTESTRAIEEPLYPVYELYQLIPLQQKPFPDVREIIVRLTDGSRFQEFKKEYGNTLVTGFASINGHTVGILANNGVLFSESANKGTHFIQLCNNRGIPMIFLQNITGFMVGKEYEHKGIVKDGAKMVNALANSTVPFVTIIIGGSYGAGNYAMAGRAFEPRFLFMWPNARISVMGARQASEVLITLRKEQQRHYGQVVDNEHYADIRTEITQKYEEEGSPYYSTSRLWDDGIIDPADTRKILSLTLNVINQKRSQLPNYGIFRM
jgi:acetyl-CoA carboxylase carboxyltransferase component